jgi:hypothetical protein
MPVSVLYVLLVGGVIIALGVAVYLGRPILR